MEFKEGRHLGGVMSELKKEIKSLSESHIANICCEVLKALNFLHSIGRVHKELNKSYVILNYHGKVKLGNFSKINFPLLS